mmetsp:Transcript_98831/g.276781  ORF Transcript_98831/g.276781 Transcript_98831/m.276781 type:complete len:382 (-) Transcript_98831:9-1154(-)
MRAVHVHADAVVDALVQGLRVVVVVDHGPLEEVEAVDDDRQLYLWVGHEVVDGQHPAGRVLRPLQAQQVLQPLDPRLLQPRRVRIPEELAHHGVLQIGASSDEDVAPRDKVAVHEQGQHHRRVGHVILREGRVEHAVGKVDGGFCPDPLLHAARLALKVVESNDLIEFVDLIAPFATRHGAGPVAHDEHLRSMEPARDQPMVRVVDREDAKELRGNNDEPHHGVIEGEEPHGMAQQVRPRRRRHARSERVPVVDRRMHRNAHTEHQRSEDSPPPPRVLGRRLASAEDHEGEDRRVARRGQKSTDHRPHAAAWDGLPVPLRGQRLAHRHRRSPRPWRGGPQPAEKTHPDWGRCARGGARTSAVPWGGRLLQRRHGPRGEGVT